MWFLPPAGSLALVAGLPFASTIQIPLDVGVATQLAMLGVADGLGRGDTRALQLGGVSDHLGQDRRERCRSP